MRLFARSTLYTAGRLPFYISVSMGFAFVKSLYYNRYNRYTVECRLWNDSQLHRLCLASLLISVFSLGLGHPI